MNKSLTSSHEMTNSQSGRLGVEPLLKPMFRFYNHSLNVHSFKVIRISLTKKMKRESNVLPWCSPTSKTALLWGWGLSPTSPFCPSVNRIFEDEDVSGPLAE